MSQHDYVVANDTGAAVRADINSALAAIVSNNSGAAAPGTTFAYQWWADTTTGLLKQRNAANSAWITIGTLASTNLGLLSLSGGTMAGDLLFTDATYDIGKTGATRPRDIFCSRNIVVSGVGPHAFGTTSNSQIQYFFGGTFAGTATGRGLQLGMQLSNVSGDTTGLYVVPSLLPVAGSVGYGAWLSPSITKAGSGTHSDFASLLVDAPTIGAGASTLTNATTLKVGGAPSVGTNQRAFWVAAGSSQFDGDVVLTTVSGAGVATQANMESNSSTTLVVTPGRLKYSPNAAKAWACFDIAGSIGASENVTSITDSGTGDWTVNLTTAFSSANFVASTSANPQTAGTANRCTGVLAQTASTIRIVCEDSSGAAADPSSGFIHVSAFGDQ